MKKKRQCSEVIFFFEPNNLFPSESNSKLFEPNNKIAWEPNENVIAWEAIMLIELENNLFGLLSRIHLFESKKIDWIRMHNADNDRATRSRSRN